MNNADPIKAEAQRVFKIFYDLQYAMVGIPEWDEETWYKYNKPRREKAARCAIACLEELIHRENQLVMDMDIPRLESYQKQTQYLTETYLKEKP